MPSFSEEEETHGHAEDGQIVVKTGVAPLFQNESNTGFPLDGARAPVSVWQNYVMIARRVESPRCLIMDRDNTVSNPMNLTLAGLRGL